MKEMSNQTLEMVEIRFAKHKSRPLKLWRKVKLE